MNKKQLVAKISSSMNLSKADAERQFDGITEIILNCLKGDEQVKIAGFGTYKVAKRKARVGRNPRTGDKVDVPEKFVVTFKPGKEMEERVRQLEQKKALEAQAAARQISEGIPAPPPGDAGLRPPEPPPRQTF